MPLAPSAYRFLTDETRLSVRLGLDIEHPIRIFTLDGLGLDEPRFIREIAPTFKGLEWDYYDVKRRQVEFLLRAFPDEAPGLLSFLPGYFAGERLFSELGGLRARLTPADDVALLRIAPFRRRAAGRFRVRYDALRDGEEAWEIVLEPMEAFMQPPSPGMDYDPRTFPRHFAPLPDAVVTQRDFPRLLRNLAEMVRGVDCEARDLRITCHQVSSVARDQSATSNSPEGIHQDGADYIVSALVVSRDGVEGGESRIYGPDQQTPYLRHILRPGQGLFQADAGSPLWHEVTLIRRSPMAATEEVARNLLGFDISRVG